MKSSENKQHPIGVPIYTTFDGVEMMEGDIMWRVCNSYGEWDGDEPDKVRFMHSNGYNGGDIYKPSYPRTHIHFFDYNKAVDYLKRFKSFPTIQELNHFISFYKPDYCPCELGKPFYPDDNCQCGG